MSIDIRHETLNRPGSTRRFGANQQVFESISGWEQLQVSTVRPPVPSEELHHTDFNEGEFWRSIPAFEEIDSETFLDHQWQSRHSITSPARLRRIVEELVPDAFLADVEAGFHHAPMAMRLSPYVVSLIDWSNPYHCAIRKQFVPVGGALLEDHPCLHLDSLNEQGDSPTAGLTHRYRDKALFLATDTCPVYCRFCTRSYAVGSDTEEVAKVAFRVNYDRWRSAFAYVASRHEIEDIVISGGDAYNLRPGQIEAIGMTLLEIPHVRRIRLATKGLAIMPQKVLSDTAWVESVARVAEFARRQHKDFAIHTHFNHPAEATWISQQAMGVLHERGIIVRNQAVMQRGVNDDPQTMTRLVRRLGYINVHPYYVYACDMVNGIEDLRTSLSSVLQVEKYVRGSTAGFNTPTFVCDLPGGGGKRDAHSYETYNRETGIAVYAAPSVKAGEYFLYFDPLHSLGQDVRDRWMNPQQREEMIDEALAEAAADNDL